jgi:predicted metal-dependent phosphoesterase TrpH
MIVDMHIHTMISSTCSMIDPDELVLKALDLGLDAICVTEHDTHEGGRVVKDIGRKQGLRVFTGMEVMSREGHLLVYGYGQDIKGVPAAADVVRAVTEAGGLVAPAHPWRRPFGWYSGALDRPLEETEFARMFKVIEMYNGMSSAAENQKGRAFCEATGNFGIGGSDAHNLLDVGAVVTEFADTISDETELVAALLTGHYTARIVTPWEARR